MSEKLSFKSFIQELLKRAKIGSDYREILTDQEGMILFTEAFTDSSYDPIHNLEVWEFSGDGIVKGILSQYIPRRFPDLVKSSEKEGKTGEGLLSKTRRMLEQSKTLSDIALKLGFWEYVKANEETLAKDRKKTLEDVFEAFIGVLVEIVDRKVKRGMGYLFSYNFLESLLDMKEINITTETLDDPVTRLNELYKASFLKNDKQPLKWGDAEYIFENITTPKVFSLPGGQFTNGDMVFLNGDKSVYVYFNGKWIHVSKAPLIKLQPAASLMPFNPDDPSNDDKVQRKLWYAGVYGYPGGNKTIIGQGVYMKKMKDQNSAKMVAAQQALNYLRSSGIEKDYTKKAERPVNA